MRRVTRLLSAIALLGISSTFACTDDGAGDELDTTETGTTDPSTSDSGDGDGDDPSGDGDGEPATGDGDGEPATGDGDGDAGCVYPDAAEPMALDQPIAAYAWPTALHADGRVAMLDLENAYCDTDEVIDWSPHDILVFVSIPAW